MFDCQRESAGEGLSKVSQHCCVSSIEFSEVGSEKKKLIWTGNESLLGPEAILDVKQLLSLVFFVLVCSFVDKMSAFLLALRFCKRTTQKLPRL